MCARQRVDAWCDVEFIKIPFMIYEGEILDGNQAARKMSIMERLLKVDEHEGFQCRRRCVDENDAGRGVWKKVPALIYSIRAGTYVCQQ